MYIEPFWCGVAATLITEVLLLVGYAIFVGARKK